MKFNARTIGILKNFAGINPSILFREGDQLSTVSSSKAILAKAKIDQSVESEFAIYDLSKFLSTLSLFSEPEITLTEKKVNISEGQKLINYSITDASLIIAAPTKEINIETEINFNLTSEKLQEAMKAMNILGLPEIAIVGENGKIFLKAINVKDKSSDNFSVEIGETDKTFSAIFSAENIKMVPNNYKVGISEKGISYWSGDDIEYWIMLESTSKFD